MYNTFPKIHLIIETHETINGKIHHALIIYFSIIVNASHVSTSFSCNTYYRTS